MLVLEKRFALEAPLKKVGDMKAPAPASSFRSKNEN
jgi:hypothetical protein